MVNENLRIGDPCPYCRMPGGACTCKGKMPEPFSEKELSDWHRHIFFGEYSDEWVKTLSGRFLATMDARDKRIAELTAERDRLKNALENIADGTEELEQAEMIARESLKGEEGETK